MVQTGMAQRRLGARVEREAHADGNGGVDCGVKMERIHDRGRSGWDLCYNSSVEEITQECKTKLEDHTEQE